MMFYREIRAMTISMEVKESTFSREVKVMMSFLEAQEMTY